jgi:hypothetical protein
MIHCGICRVDYADDEVLGKTRGFMCQCVSNVCIPCITLMCLQDTKFVAGDDEKASTVA